jgi:hypothetical protein
VLCCTYGTSAPTPLKTVWRCDICEAPLREWSKIDIILSHGYSWLLLAIHRFAVEMVLNSTSDMQVGVYFIWHTIPSQLISCTNKSFFFRFIMRNVAWCLSALRSRTATKLVAIGFRCISFCWNLFVLFRTGVEVCLLKLFVRQTWNLRTDASVSRNFVMCKQYLPFCHVLFLHILQRLQDERYFV